MTPQSLEQRRAANALSAVRQVEKRDAKLYVSYAKALPATILQLGLGQAMATLLSKSQGKPDPHQMLYKQVSGWLCSDDPDVPFRKRHDRDLMQLIVDADQDAYVLAQAEALAYIDWLKKFAVAYLSPEARRAQEATKAENG